MGKRNKRKNQNKYTNVKNLDLKWEDLIDLRTTTLKQIADYINAVKLVNRTKLHEIYIMKESDIQKDIEDAKNELGANYDAKKTEIEKEILDKYLVMSKEDTLILSGAINLINDITNQVDVISKNHVIGNIETTINVEEKLINFKKGKVKETEFETFVMCYGKYTELFERLCDIGSKVMVELSTIVDNNPDIKDKLLEISKNITNLRFNNEGDNNE